MQDKKVVDFTGFNSYVRVYINSFSLQKKLFKIQLQLFCIIHSDSKIFFFSCLRRAKTDGSGFSLTPEVMNHCALRSGSIEKPLGKNSKHIFARVIRQNILSAPGKHIFSLLPSVSDPDPFQTIRFRIEAAPKTYQNHGKRNKKLSLTTIYTKKNQIIY